MMISTSFIGCLLITSSFPTERAVSERSLRGSRSRTDLPARRTTTGKNGARGLYSPETVEFILRAFYVLAGRVRAEGGQDIYIVTARSISLCHDSGHSCSVSSREHPPERISFDRRYPRCAINSKGLRARNAGSCCSIVSAEPVGH